MGAHLHFEVRRQRADGSDPFPGAYGRHNLDPEEWLAEVGVVYGRHGVLDMGEEAVSELGDSSLEVEHGAWLVTRYRDDAAVAAVSP